MVGATVDCGFQNHFIGRVSKLWPPRIMHLSRLDVRCQKIKKRLDRLSAKPCAKKVLRPHQNRFIFHKQSDTGNQHDTALDDPSDELV